MFEDEDWIQNRRRSLQRRGRGRLLGCSFSSLPHSGECTITVNGVFQKIPYDRRSVATFERYSLKEKETTGCCSLCMTERVSHHTVPLNVLLDHGRAHKQRMSDRIGLGVFALMIFHLKIEGSEGGETLWEFDRIVQIPTDLIEEKVDNGLQFI